MESPLKRTNLFENHLKLNAKMIPFAGWEMPLSYRGILEEVIAVREKTGIFDVSHMGEIIVEGTSSVEFLERVLSNTVQTLKPMKARYSFLLDENGCFIDDLIVYRISQNKFLLCVNAINTEKDLGWLIDHKKGDVNIDDLTLTYSLLSIQGRDAERITKVILNKPEISDLTFYSFLILKENEAPTIVSRTGYTGEDGFEIFYPGDNPEIIWEKAIELGAMPCGLGARDTLRIEACYPLYGHEIDDKNTPLEAELMRFVDMKKNFIGKDALLKRKPSEMLIAFKLKTRNVPREGNSLLSQNEVIGRVTSGTFSPILKCGIGMGYVKREYNEKTIFVEMRGQRVEGEIVEPPFVPYRVKRGGSK